MAHNPQQQGLVAGAMGPQGEPQQQPQEPQQPQQGGEETTPQEQEAYERTVLAGTEVVYGEETNQPILRMLEEGAENPPQVIAKVTTTIMVQLDEQSGGKIPEVVILQAAQEIAGEVAVLGTEAGLFQLDPTMENQVVQLVVRDTGSAFGVTEEEIQAFLATIPQEEQERAVAEQQQYNGAQQTPQGAPQ